MAGYLDGDISGSVQGLQQIAAQQLQAEQDKKKPKSTEDLYKQSQLQEQGFADTAPKGYFNMTDDLKNVDPKLRNNPNFYEGYMKVKRFQMEEAQQGMAQEDMAQKRTDRDKFRMINDGMAKAAQDGGYEGVIDYLKTVDPDRALAFHKAKLELDKSMMQNDMYKTMLPIEKGKALIDGYGALGKMGSALLSAPPEGRQAMYDYMKPMVKAINPNAPDNVNATVPMFTLAAFQATPANLLYGNKIANQTMQSNTGKLVSDINRAAALYGPDSDEVKALRQTLDANIRNKNLSGAQMLNAMTSMVGKNQMNQEAVLRKDFYNQNKNFATMQDQYNKIQTIKETYNNPNAGSLGPSDLSLMFTFMKILDPTSVVREGEQASFKNAGSVPDKIRSQYNSLLKGGTISPNLRNEYLKTATQLYEASKSSFETSKKQYEDIATQKGLNPQSIIMNLNSTLENQSKIINSKADAMLQKYSNNPDAIKRIENLRDSQLNELRRGQDQQDYNAEKFLQKYGR